MMKQCGYCGEWHTSLEGCRLVPNNGFAPQPLPAMCPAPFRGDDGTERQCIERGHCGCDSNPTTAKGG